VRAGWLGLAVLLGACAPVPEAGPLPEPSDLAQVEALDGDSLRDRSGTDYRLIGINAPDVGECLADEAAARLAELVAGGVSLVGDVEPTDQFGRKLVYAYAGDLVNRTLVSEGLAVPIHSDPNSRFTSAFFAAMEEAVENRRGVWNPEACGTGPLPAIAIVHIEGDPPGPDEEDLEGEYVELANHGDAPLDLTGWTLRDESTRNRYSFPSGFTLDPGQRVTITSGTGPLGFGTGSPIWNNSGDTAFLIDQDGRFVAFHRVEGRAAAPGN
jgi:endonuclease YncB( thermonuclease family)